MENVEKIFFFFDLISNSYLKGKFPFDRVVYSIKSTFRFDSRTTTKEYKIENDQLTPKSTAFKKLD